MQMIVFVLYNLNSLDLCYSPGESSQPGWMFFVVVCRDGNELLPRLGSFNHQQLARR